MACFNGSTIRKEIIQRLAIGTSKQFINSIFEVTQKIKNLGLSDSEIGLFSAIIIITPGEGKSFADRKMTVFWAIYFSKKGHIKIVK